jgi:hypothetical protein
LVGRTPWSAGEPPVAHPALATDTPSILSPKFQIP